MPLLDLALAPDATAPREARHAIAPVVAEVGADTAAITLAVSEAVTRAVSRGSRTGEKPPVHLHAERDEEHVVVVVENAAGDPVPADEAEGGIGMVTLGRLTEHLAVEREGAWTRLIMHFPLRPADASR